jgi:hypothetical protein
MSDEPLPQSEIILYQEEDGRTRIQCRMENETLWLTQARDQRGSEPCGPGHPPSPRLWRTGRLRLIGNTQGIPIPNRETLG